MLVLLFLLPPRDKKQDQYEKDLCSYVSVLHTYFLFNPLCVLHFQGEESTF